MLYYFLVVQYDRKPRAMIKCLSAKCENDAIDALEEQINNMTEWARMKRSDIVALRQNLKEL